MKTVGFYLSLIYPLILIVQFISIFFSLHFVDYATLAIVEGAVYIALISILIFSLKQYKVVPYLLGFLILDAVVSLLNILDVFYGLHVIDLQDLIQNYSLFSAFIHLLIFGVLFYLFQFEIKIGRGLRIFSIIGIFRYVLIIGNFLLVNVSVNVYVLVFSAVVQYAVLAIYFQEAGLSRSFKSEDELVDNQVD